MFTLTVENDKGERLRLSNSPAYAIRYIDGLLAPQATISAVTATNRDGKVVTNVRAENRVISIAIAPKPPVEENRQRLYTFFPAKKEITLHFANENRDVKITGIVEAMDGSLFKSAQTITININCANPYFRNDAASYEEIYKIKSLFEFPFEIEEEGIEFSTIDEELRQIILNDGDVETGLTIEIEAMADTSNPIIYNANTREFFGVNIEMETGNIIRIQTDTGKKKVELIRGAEVTNIINNIMKGVTWLTLAPGENLFTYSNDTRADAIKLGFYYTLLFEGV